MSLADFLRAACDVLWSSPYQAGAFKPNPGYFYRFDRPLQGDFSGSRLLAELITCLRDRWPGVPVIFDFKRGDIGPSSANYAFEAFESWGADAATVSPYMGGDSLSPFLAYSERGRGIYVLVRTSNLGAKDLQDLRCLSQLGGEDPPRESSDPTQLQEGLVVPLYLRVLRWLRECNNSSCGAVIGATWPQELALLAREAAPAALPLLIPGVGKQGGDLTTTLQTLRDNGYPLALARVNLSSAWLQPWAGEAPSNWQDCISEALRGSGEVMRHFWQQP